MTPQEHLTPSPPPVITPRKAAAKPRPLEYAVDISTSLETTTGYLLRIVIRLIGFLFLLWAVWGTLARIMEVFTRWTSGIIIVGGGGMEWHRVVWNALLGHAAEYLIGTLILILARPISRFLIR